jgi:hypothetical protein
MLPAVKVSTVVRLRYPDGECTVPLDGHYKCSFEKQTYSIISKLLSWAVPGEALLECTVPLDGHCKCSFDAASKRNVFDNLQTIELGWAGRGPASSSDVAMHYLRPNYRVYLLTSATVGFVPT